MRSQVTLVSVPGARVKVRASAPQVFSAREEVLSLLLFGVVAAIDTSNFNRMMAERARIEAAGKLDEGDRGPTYELSPLGPIPILIGLVGAAVTVTGAVMWIQMCIRDRLWGKSSYPTCTTY